MFNTRFIIPMISRLSSVYISGISGQTLEVTVYENAQLIFTSFL
jgi:hypothetical protein